MISIALVVLLATRLCFVMCFGREGHYLVSLLARDLCTRESRAKLDKIFPSIEDLCRASKWADEVKSCDQYKWSENNHYLHLRNDFHHIRRELHDPYLAHYETMVGNKTWHYFRDMDEKERTFDRVINTTDCMQSPNIVIALSNHTERLRELHKKQTKGVSITSKDKQLREEDLKFVIHYMGDSHQCLHLCGICNRGRSVRIKYREQIITFNKLFNNIILMHMNKELFGGNIVLFKEHLLTRFKGLKKEEKEMILHLDKSGRFEPDFNWYCEIISEIHAKYSAFLWNLERYATFNKRKSEQILKYKKVDISDYKFILRRIMDILEELIVIAGYRLAKVLDKVL